MSVIPFRSVKLILSPDKDLSRALKNILGFYPGNIGIYKLAFIHKSASVVKSKGGRFNNERLEYLGDAVLDLIVADFMYNRYPGKEEGFLTKMRSKIVNREFLNSLATKIGINNLIVSHLNKDSGVKNIYGNTFEAFIAAVYIDKGYNRTKKYVIDSIFDKYIDLQKLEKIDTDFKSSLIEWAQKHKKEIVFETEEESVDPANQITFVSNVLIDQVVMGKGTGNSKKEAEQNASDQALSGIKV